MDKDLCLPSFVEDNFILLYLLTKRIETTFLKGSLGLDSRHLLDLQSKVSKMDDEIAYIRLMLDGLTLKVNHKVSKTNPTSTFCPIYMSHIDIKEVFPNEQHVSHYEGVK